jgi:hypothetical protein
MFRGFMPSSCGASLDRAPVRRCDPGTREGSDGFARKLGVAVGPDRVDRAFYAGHGNRRRRSDLPGHLGDASIEAVAGHDLLDQARLVRLRRGQYSAPKQQVQGPAAAEERSESLRSAPRRHQTQRYLSEADARVLGGDSKVAGKRQLGAATEGIAVDPGDHRHLRRRDAIQRRPHAPSHRSRVLVRTHALQFLEVAARAKGLVALPADHDHPRALDAGGVERLVELGHRPERERVARVRAVDGDDSDTAVELESQVPQARRFRLVPPGLASSSCRGRAPC